MGAAALGYFRGQIARPIPSLDVAAMLAIAVCLHPAPFPLFPLLTCSPDPLVTRSGDARHRRLPPSRAFPLPTARPIPSLHVAAMLAIAVYLHRYVQRG